MGRCFRSVHQPVYKGSQMTIEMAKKPYAKVFNTKSLTKQAHKAECDINNIMKRFEKTGMLEHANTFKGQYGDFTDVPQSYQDALEQVREAEGMFMTLPAKARKRFENNPGAFLGFVQDPTNREEMIELGLLKPDPPAVEPLEPPSTPPAGDPPGTG